MLALTTLPIAVLGFGAALALIAFVAFDRAEEKATIRASLRQLGGYEVDNVRDRELLAPINDRVVQPTLHWLTQVGRRLTPEGYVEAVRHKLLVAGRPTKDSLDRFLAVRVITIVPLIPIWFVFCFVLLRHLHSKVFHSGLAVPAIFLLLVLVSVLGPDTILARWMEERQHAIRVKLPDILDLLVISVEAGLGFEQALDRTVASVPGPLSEEFVRMLNEVRAGSSRADAMRALDTRTDVPEVRSFVLAILQADTFGVSIGRVLRSQADEMRVKRRQLAQEQAQKLPVKLLFPMVFCIFPALFVVVLGPAIINISKGFK